MKRSHVLIVAVLGVPSLDLPAIAADPAVNESARGIPLAYDVDVVVVGAARGRSRRHTAEIESTPRDMALRAQTTASKVTNVAVIGTMDISGEGVPFAARLSYPQQLGAMLGNGYRVTVSQRDEYIIRQKLEGPLRLQYRGFLPRFGDSQPDIVILHLGLNESRDTVWAQVHSTLDADLDKLLNRFDSMQPPPELYISFPVVPLRNSGDHNRTRLVAEIIPRLKAAASKHGLQVIDTAAAMEGDEALYRGPLTINAKGAFVMASEVSHAIAGKSLSVTSEEFIEQRLADLQLPKLKTRSQITPEEWTAMRQVCSVFGTRSTPPPLKGEFYKRYGGIGKMPETWADMTPEHIERAEQGKLAMYNRLAYLYHNDKDPQAQLHIKELFTKCARALMQRDNSRGGMTYRVPSAGVPDLRWRVC